MGQHTFPPYTEGARVYNSANLLIPTATLTTLTFDSERYDTDDIHSIIANTDRLTCKTAGKYLIIGEVQWAINAVGYRRVFFWLNGAVNIAHISYLPTAWLSGHTISTIYDLAVNDFVVINVEQTSGGNLNVRAAANHSPEFMMQRIG